MLEDALRIHKKSELIEWINTESIFYPVSTLDYLLQVSEMAILKKHMILLRKAEYYTNTGLRFLAKLYVFRLLKLQNKYALHVPLNCCGKGLHIMHLGPILINDKATIGQNVALHINTGIVAGGTNNGAPTIGNGVVVGIGAVILGGVVIADNTAIGANAVVNKDVLEENIAVAGVPAHKISDHGRLEWNKK